MLNQNEKKTINVSLKNSLVYIHENYCLIIDEINDILREIDTKDRQVKTKLLIDQFILNQNINKNKRKDEYFIIEEVIILINIEPRHFSQ